MVENSTSSTPWASISYHRTTHFVLRNAGGAGAEKSCHFTFALSRNYDKYWILSLQYPPCVS